jgi:hypothetical protein
VTATSLSIRGAPDAPRLDAALAAAVPLGELPRIRVDASVRLAASSRSTAYTEALDAVPNGELEVRVLATPGRWAVALRRDAAVQSWEYAGKIQLDDFELTASVLPPLASRSAPSTSVAWLRVVNAPDGWALCVSTRDAGDTGLFVGRDAAGRSVAALFTSIPGTGIEDPRRQRDGLDEQRAWMLAGAPTWGPPRSGYFLPAAAERTLRAAPVGEMVFSSGRLSIEADGLTKTVPAPITTRPMRISACEGLAVLRAEHLSPTRWETLAPFGDSTLILFDEPSRAAVEAGDLYEEIEAEVNVLCAGGLNVLCMQCHGGNMVRVDIGLDDTGTIVAVFLETGWLPE